MAYEAVDSLVKKLIHILDHQNTSCFIDSQRRRLYFSFLLNGIFSSCNANTSCTTCALLQKKLEIQSLYDDAVFLRSFLKDFPGKETNLEAQLRDAAKQAKDIFDAIDNFDLDENDPGWKQIFQVLDKSIEQIDSLLHEAKRFKIVPIVGMGGIEKTNLARYIYQEPSTIHHFDVRAWVTVSQNSSAKSVLSSLLSSIDPSNKTEYKCMNEASLVLRGHTYLKKRRYLIVMDDMRYTNVWDDVRMAFPDECNGSRIIITTSNSDVGSYVDSSNHPHNMQMMSVNQSWRLLKECVFEQENCPPELEEIGERIAEKCKGLPLAIVVIAGILSKLEQNQGSWEKVARNVSDAVNSSSNEQFSDILSMSYIYLPPYLRPCFLYMACFPEDYEISVSKLIRLWAAEGFLISDESKDMDELGYEYLEDLVRRNLVWIEKKRYDGKIITVKIHDVLRDLCIRKSRDENFLLVIKESEGKFPQGIENSNRMSVCSNVRGSISNMDHTAIQTMLVFTRHWKFHYAKHFRLLKVLDSMTVEIDLCGADLCELIHLRYLSLTVKHRFKVPESLCKLQNLQTLIMKKFDGFGTCVYLPVTIWRMPKLRHIILINCTLPDPSTDHCQEDLPLANLHTLSCVIDFTCSERILKMLPNLKKLQIRYEGSLDETGWSKYSLNNLVHLSCLEKLSLHTYCYNRNLAFPETLKRLTLSGSIIPWEDMTILGSLPNLEVLKLKLNTSCGTKWETAEGEFRQLKVLLIDTTNLHEWMTQSSHFPRLEHLTLYKCDKLKEIPYGIGEIPTLQLIEVDVRDLSVVQSVKGIQEQQQSSGNDLEVSLLKSRSWKRYPYKFF